MTSPASQEREAALTKPGQEAEAERDAVVKWLREQCGLMLLEYAIVLGTYADAIERGDHRKGE